MHQIVEQVRFGAGARNARSKWHGKYKSVLVLAFEMVIKEHAKFITRALTTLKRKEVKLQNDARMSSCS